MAFRILKEIAGAATPVAQVSREHARRVQDLLSKLPPNSTKKFANFPLEQVAALAMERRVKLLERKTAENILRNLSAFFSWAIKEHYIARNPMPRLVSVLRAGVPIAQFKETESEIHSWIPDSPFCP